MHVMIGPDEFKKRKDDVAELMKLKTHTIKNFRVQPNDNNEFKFKKFEEIKALNFREDQLVDLYPLQVSNLWNGTKLIFNEDIAEINDFKKRLICSDSSLPADNTYGPQAKVMSFSPQRMKSVLQFSKFHIFGLQTVDGTCLDALAALNKDLGLDHHMNVGDKHPTTDPILRYRLGVQVTDGDIQAKFFFWDNCSIDLLGLNNGIAIKPTEDSPSQSHFEAEIYTPKQLKLMDSQDDADIPTQDLSASAEFDPDQVSNLTPSKRSADKEKEDAIQTHQPSSSRKKNHNLPHKLCVIYNEDVTLIF
ncbi:hypothetical protein TSUD_400490 [Trifolium subterraneum]|uniref:Uncharacterized protein n=1 Tax=Trifolium subterraneum TaxID=3900 RepID=A0A2Z6NMQ9_TRISU|nr:hypothetical protein TSUD_400490 [Trifolium subterraneum]